MQKINQVRDLFEQAAYGNPPVYGDVAQSEEVMGFSFGLHFNEQGQLGSAGPVNEAIADFIVSDEIIRSKNMTLQEELAIEVKKRDPLLAQQVNSLKTIKKPGVAYNTYELIQIAKPDFSERKIGSLAVVAFRHHLPRAAAHVRKAGFEVATPDMSNVGDFDNQSSQPWIHNQKKWIRRERLVITAFAVLNRI